MLHLANEKHEAFYLVPGSNHVDIQPYYRRSIIRR